jgi:hypothetical protein
MPPRPRAVSPEQVLAAIPGTYGIQSMIARKCGVSGRTIRRIMNEDSRVEDAVLQAREDLKDFAEAQLIKLIQEKNLIAILFFLKCQAKARGYVERQEITGADGEPVTLTLSDRLRQLHRSGQLKDFTDRDLLLPAPAGDTDDPDEDQDEEERSLQ